MMADFTIEIAGKAKTFPRLSVKQLIEMTDGAYRYEYDAIAASRADLQDADAEFRNLRNQKCDPSLLAKFGRTLEGGKVILNTVGMTDEEIDSLSRGGMIDAVAEACFFTVEQSADTNKPTLTDWKWVRNICIVAKEFPGLGDPTRLDIEDFIKAIDYAVELQRAK